MNAAIDIAGLAFLRALVADIEEGRAVLTLCSLRDDADGQGAALTWGPPGAPSPSPSPSPSPPPSTAPPGICPTCSDLAEVVGDGDGGGFYCNRCDLSFE